MAGKLTRRGVGGVRRSSHHSSGSAARPTSSQGEMKLRLPSPIMSRPCRRFRAGIISRSRRSGGRGRASPGSAGRSVRVWAMVQPSPRDQAFNTVAMQIVALDIGVMDGFDPAQQQLAFAPPAPRSGPGRGRAGIPPAGSSDHEQMALHPALGMRAQHRLDRRQGREEIAHQHELGMARQSAGPAAGSPIRSHRPRRALARSRAMRSSVARLAEGGRSPPSSATRSPPRSSREASARVRTSARSRLRGSPAAECQSIDGAGIAPEPDALGRGPFGLAHEEAVGFCRLAPVDARGGLARLVLTELPEGVAGADPPAAMHALLDGGRDPKGGDQQGRQARRQVLGLAPRRLLDRRRPARSLSLDRCLRALRSRPPGSREGLAQPIDQRVQGDPIGAGARN